MMKGSIRGEKGVGKGKGGRTEEMGVRSDQRRSGSVYAPNRLRGREADGKSAESCLLRKELLQTGPAFASQEGSKKIAFWLGERDWFMGYDEVGRRIVKEVVKKAAQVKKIRDWTTEDNKVAHGYSKRWVSIPSSQRVFKATKFDA